jgi:hypothetical protein
MSKCPLAGPSRAVLKSVRRKRRVETVNSRRPVSLAVLVCFYAAAFVVLTYPLATNIGSGFISDGKDGCVFPWNIYNFRESVLEGQNPFFTNRIFHPFGTSLVLHVYAPVSGLAGLAISNPVLALNLTVLLSFVFSGLGAYLLCRRYVRSRPVAALAGFAYAYCPYKLMHLYGHYDLLLSASIPFFVLFWLKSFAWEAPGGADGGADGGRWARPRIASPRSLVLAAVFYALTLFSCYYYAYFLIIFIALHLAFFGLRIHEARLSTRRNLIRAIVIVLVSTGAVGLFHLAGLDREGPTRIGLGQSADALAFLVPSAYSRFLASGPVEHLRLDVIRANEAESTVYMGYAILVFVLVYLAARDYRRETPEGRMLTFMTGAYLAFAAPIVLVADRIVCALPTALLHYIPFLNNFRVPYRFDVMLMLFAPILAGVAIERHVLVRLPRKLHLAFVAALVAILFVEYAQVSYPVVSRHDVPRVYERLAASEDGTLLEIPFGLRDGFRMIGDERTVQMYYQTIHHKAILGGLVSRPAKHLFASFQSEPVVSDLLAMMAPGQTSDTSKATAPYSAQPMESGQPTTPATQPVPRARVDKATAAGFLAKFGVRYVVIYPEYIATPASDYIEASLSPFITDREEIDHYTLITLAAPPAPQ